jgi:hypothetical protein
VNPTRAWRIPSPPCPMAPLLVWRPSTGSRPCQCLEQETADQALSVCENQLPRIRERIRADGYESWALDRQILVSFVAMMAARSPLFRTQSVSMVESSLVQEPNSEAHARNFSITLMRSEMKRRATEWDRFDWALGYTENPEDPLVTGDQPVGMRGAARDQRTAWQRNDFWLWCPIAWDMCMIASSLPLIGPPTTALSPEYLAEIRTLTAKQATRFVASPCVLADILNSPSAPH